MPFADASRCVYKETSLIDVVCQLRFPPILMIDSQLPAAFQEAIRDKFPNFIQEKSIQQNVIQIQGITNPLTTVTEAQMYKFESADHFSFIQLARTFITMRIQNGAYRRWEEFYETFSAVVRKFEEIYKPSFYTRIGLEYINVFDDALLQKVGGKNSLSINSKFLSSCDGILGDDEIKSFSNTCEVKLDEACTGRITTQTVVSQANQTDSGIMLDYDLFKASNTDLSEMKDILFFLHDCSTRILRTVITSKMHNIMEPGEL